MRVLTLPLRRVLSLSAVLRLVGGLVVALGLMGVSHAETPLPPVRNLQASTAEAAKHDQPLIVMFSLPSCPYCEKLRRTQYQFLARQGYMVQQIEMNDRKPVTGFDGKPTTGAKLAVRYDIHLAPTVLFFGPGGKEIGPRIVGALTEDFYGAYLDKSIEESAKALKGAGST